MPLTDSERAQSVADAWRIGRLRYKLEPEQASVYDALGRAVPEEPFITICHRGFGKTFLGCDWILEGTRQDDDCNELIISSTLKKLRVIVKPAFDTLLEDCPLAYLPRYNSQDSLYHFPSRNVNVHLLAAQGGHIENARGIHKVKRVLIDEAGFFGYEEDSYPLDHVIQNILLPMFIRTKSTPRIVIMTTPPEIATHPIKAYVDRAKVSGCYEVRDIYHSDIPVEKREEQKRRMLQQPGGEIAWQREMECQWIVDPQRLCVPEWDNSYAVAIKPDPYYPLYKHYIFLDWGYTDFTAVAFATHLFRKGRLQVEGELAFSDTGARSDKISAAIDREATRLWGENWETEKQVADSADPLMTQEINKYAKMNFVPVQKADSLDAMIQQFRTNVNMGRIGVDPKCVFTKHCLENAIWDKRREKLDRDAFARHFDHLMALVYGDRMMDYNLNPIPANYLVDGVRIINFDYDAQKQKSDAAMAMEGMFRVGRS